MVARRSSVAELEGGKPNPRAMRMEKVRAVRGAKDEGWGEERIDAA